MSHILLRLNGTDLAQFPDTELTITRTNPYFNDGTEVESYPFDVPLDGNRQHFQNAEVIESDATIHPVRNGIMEVIVDGVPMISGKCGSIEDQELKDRVSLKLESAVKTLDEYLEGVRCRDVELKDDILIGETIGNVEFSLDADLHLIMAEDRNVPGIQHAGIQQVKLFTEPISIPAKNAVNEPIADDPRSKLAVQLPALGFSRPAIYTTRVEAGQSSPFADDRLDSFGSVGVDPEKKYTRSFINTEQFYPAAPYCNARVSYLHYREGDKDGESSDQVDTRTDQTDEYGKYNPYMMLEANRPASGLCFYVLYFLDCLFATISDDGIYYDKTDLLKVQDLCRLAFFTTHCKFDVRQRIHPSLGPMHLNSVKTINSWLHSRNIDTTLAIDDKDRTVHINSLTIDDKVYEVGGDSPFGIYVWELDPVTGHNHQVLKPYTISDIKYEIKNVKNCNITADVMEMYANSQNFPDADAKEILDSLWGAFGIRFYLDPDTRIVKPRFMRDIMRDQSDPILFHCTVIDATKMTEDIRGFRMAYGGTSDEQQREDNITLGVRDYDTTYDYQDYGNIDITRDYKEILTQLHDSNMTCYVDLNTGNRFRVKIDGDAESDVAEDYTKRKNLAPVFFEVAQLSPVEIGDCSDENKDFIVEVTNSFQPVVFNDLNYREESKAISATVFSWNDTGTGIKREVRLGTDGPQKQILSAFISEDMWHENIKRRLLFPMGTEHVQFKLTADITTKESFDPTSSDDGDSPLQHADWGLAIAIMRGGGSDSRIDYYDFDYDGFGNAKYRTVAGTDYSMSLDSIDCYGQHYDYNGDLPGTDYQPSGYYGPYDTRYDGTYTKAEAAAQIATIWAGSNADLTSQYRKVSGESALHYGWEEARGADFCTVLSRTHCLTDYDGKKREFLVTPISDNGFIYTLDQLVSYLSRLEVLAATLHQSIMSLDVADEIDDVSIHRGRRLIIQQFDDVNEANQYHSPWADFYSEILHQFHAIYYGEANEVHCPEPYSNEHFSLKLRAYTQAPRDIYDKDGRIIPAGEPLCVADPAIRNRGLFDTFFSEYAHWLLHRKKVKLTIVCEVAALLDIQWHKRYRFGDYVGFINKITSHITAENGLETVEIELFV